MFNRVCAACGRSSKKTKPCEGCGQPLCAKCHPEASEKCKNAGGGNRPMTLITWANSAAASA